MRQDVPAKNHIYHRWILEGILLSKKALFHWEQPTFHFLLLSILADIMAEVY